MHTGRIAPLISGGFGSVFKARNRLDNVTYAIKKIVLKHHGRYELNAIKFMENQNTKMLICFQSPTICQDPS